MKSGKTTKSKVGSSIPAKKPTVSTKAPVKKLAKTTTKKKDEI